MGSNGSGFAMFLFCWFTMNNGFSWLMFAPVTHDVISFYAPVMTRQQVELLNSWQPFVYLLAVLPIMKLISGHDGLRKSVRFGVTCEMAGSLLKLASVFMQHSEFTVLLLNLGQILSALASPVAIGAPSALSATWYDAEERTRATAAAVLFNNVGNALSYTLVPVLTHLLGFEYVVYLEVLMALAATVATFAFFPAVPPTIKMYATPTRPLRTQLTEMASNASVVLLFLVYCWSSGAFVGWQSMFDAMYDHYFGAVFMGQVSFIGTVGYVLGGMISSYLTDVYFRRHMKYVIVISCALNVLACVGFLLMMPGSTTRVVSFVDVRGRQHSSVDADGIVLDWGRGWILIMAGLCGIFNGSAAPIFYELVAEISFPVEEGISGNVISMCENVGSLFIYQVVARFVSLSSMNIVFTAGMVVVTFLGLLVKERYVRTEAFEAVQEKLAHTKLLRVSESTALLASEDEMLQQEEEEEEQKREGGVVFKRTRGTLLGFGPLSMDELDIYAMTEEQEAEELAVLEEAVAQNRRPPQVRRSLHQSWRGNFLGKRGTYGPPPRNVPPCDLQGQPISRVKQFGYGAV